MCKPLDIDNREHKALLERIISGDVVLFLGSGFSIGAKCKKRSEDLETYDDIPNVKKLKSLLAQDFLHDAEAENDNLMEICEECQETNASQYAEYMRSLFTTSSICGFHKDYSSINWKEIYTINVDDVIERTFDDSSKLCCIYTEKPVHASPNSIKLYKLHGCAVKNPDKIVFSASDYVFSASRRNDCRFEALSAALTTENFIFLGTTLSEEWDINIKCQMSDIYTVTNKTFFISKNFDEKTIKKLRRKFTNPIFIQETAESFIAKVLEYKNKHEEEKILSVEKWHFREIHAKKYDVTEYLTPDLYLGKEPVWEDIFSNHDVIWEKTKKLIEEIEKNGMAKSMLILGKPISGKTVMLYRLGAFLSTRNKVYEYVGTEFLDDLKGYVSQLGTEQETSIILLDDANWAIGRIKEILQIIADKNVRFIATLREKEFEKKQHLFDDGLYNEIRIVDRINDLDENDIELYLDKLNEKSFLGRYAYKYASNKKRLIEEIMEELKGTREDPLLKLALKFEYGDELDKRIKEISDSVINNKNYNIRRFAVILYFLDVIGSTGLRLSLFLDLYPMDKDDLNIFLSDLKESLISNISASSWQHSEYGKIVIHSRLSKIIKNVIAGIEYRELEEILEDIFHSMNRVHHFKCRQSNSYHNYVLYTLLRSQNINKLFRAGKEQTKWKYINRLYENLHEDYGDYYLYWLHRGISEVKMKDFNVANIHLEQARATRGGYSYEIEHSVAMLYFEEAIHSTDFSNQKREEKLNKALEIIRSQIERKENDAFTIHSFVVKVIQYYDAVHEEIPQPLLKDVLEYYYLARNRFSLDKSKIRRNMLSSIYNFLVKNEKIYQDTFSINREELDYLARRYKENSVTQDVLDLI